MLKPPVPFNTSLKTSFKNLQNKLEAVTNEITRIEQHPTYKTPFCDSHTAEVKIKASRESSSRKIHYGFGTITADYHVKEQRRWFRASLWSAVITLSDANGLFEAITYTLPPEKPDQIIESLCSAVGKRGYKHEVESKLLISVESMSGLAGLSRKYFVRKHQQLAQDVCEKLKNDLLVIKKQLQDLAAQAEKVEQKPTVLAQEYFEQQKTLTDQKLQKYLSKQKQMADAKFALKNKKLDELLEKNHKLQENLNDRISQYENKLAGHREKIDAQYLEIIPILNDIFPDLEPGYNRGRTRRGTYDYIVDASLKMFYSQILKEALYENCWFEVKPALDVLRLIRNNCYAKNRRPEGKELRECVAGLLAVLDYVEKHEMLAEDAIERLRKVSKNIGSPKPGVEEFIETALHYDFKMSLYRKKLHKEGAASKKQLGLK